MMASSSEVHAQQWMAQAGIPADAGVACATPPTWIEALGLASNTAHPDFREGSPFDPKHSQPTPEPAPAPEPETIQSAGVSPEEEAYLRGYAEGHAEAKRVADAALAQERARFRDLRMAFRALDAAGIDALAQDLNATVLALCENVLGEYALDAEALQARCEVAAKRIGPGPRGLTLHLHPDTLARLEEETLPGWTLEVDPTLGVGALRLTNGEGAVRDGPEEWMRAIAEALQA